MSRTSSRFRQRADSLPPLLADALALLFCALSVAVFVAVAWLTI